VEEEDHSRTRRTHVGLACNSGLDLTDSVGEFLRYRTQRVFDWGDFERNGDFSPTVAPPYRLESPIPISPTVTIASDPSRSADALSSKRAMPTSADPAAPIPVQTA